VTGLIVGAEYNTQTTISRVPVMVMACVKPLAIKYAIFVNPFATNAVKTAQIHSWWYEEIARIDPAQRNSDPPPAYNSVVNELSTILLITDIVHQALTKITCSRTAMVYHCNTSNSISNSSNLLERFRVGVGTGTELLQRFLPHKNPDRCNWAGCTTNNPAFQPHNFGSY